MKPNEDRWLFSVNLYPPNGEPITLRGCTECDEMNVPGVLRILDKDGTRICTTLPYLFYPYKEVPVEAK